MSAGKSVQLTLTRAEWDVVRDLVRHRAKVLKEKEGRETAAAPVEVEEYWTVRALATKVETIEAARLARDGA